MFKLTPKAILISFLFSAIFFLSPAQTKTEYANPIIGGFHPDPSICRVDDNYYLVNSTFAYFPGINIFKSKDLVNWNLIGYALDRPEQLNLDSAGVSRGLFAPTIRYNKGIYYIVCTLVDKGGNFVVTSKNPEGPWSNPVWLPEVNGIDPSLYFDDNDKAYIIFNSIPPDDKPLYQGHRTIRMFNFDYNDLKVKGEEILLINGGTDINKKPVWIEAPYIFKMDGLYYLICAEGGTAYDHSEVVFRSEKAEGPYIPYKNNPILTQRTLNPNRSFPITSAGHADFVQTQAGDWWAVFLACRPYTGDYYNLGRETFMIPVKWEEGWPVMTRGGEVVKHSYPNPLPIDKDFKGIQHGGSFKYTDEFNSEKLNLEWIYLRTPRSKWIDLSDKKGSLAMQLRPETVSGNMNPSFLARRQQHNTSSASIGLNVSPKSENEKSGLLVFQSEFSFYFLCKSIENNKPVIQLLKAPDKNAPEFAMEVLATHILSDQESTKELHLKIESHGSIYSFHYGFDDQKMFCLKDSVDAKFLSTKAAGGFVGCLYALYSTSLGKLSQTSAYFNWFKYNGINESIK